MDLVTNEPNFITQRYSKSRKLQDHKEVNMYVKVKHGDIADNFSNSAIRKVLMH